jgi:hypothetical protein
MRRALALGVAVALLAASAAQAHQGNPNYRSVVDSITPAAPPPASAPSDNGGDASKGLGWSALILGALGLVAGLAAFGLRRSGLKAG